jgi:predicted MarR family transcription regulator
VVVIPAETMTPGQLSYDLRRLRHHGLVERITGTHRYNVTDHGLHMAAFLTRAHTRLLRDGLSDILDHAAFPTPVRRHLDRLTTAVNDYARKQKLAT